MIGPLRTAEALDPISTPQGRAEARDRRRAILRVVCLAGRPILWGLLAALGALLVAHIAEKAIGQVIHDTHGGEVSKWAS